MKIKYHEPDPDRRREELKQLERNLTISINLATNRLREVQRDLLMLRREKKQCGTTSA